MLMKQKLKSKHNWMLLSQTKWKGKGETKIIREYEKIIKEHLEELTTCRAEVSKTVDKNVKLAEENKTLHALIEANNDLEEELGNQTGENDLENDEVFADSILTINGVKYRRTSPVTEAEETKRNDKSRETGTKAKQYSCDKCAEVFQTMGLLRRHSKTKHGASAPPQEDDSQESENEPASNKCTKCTFVSDSKETMTKHVQDQHGVSHPSHDNIDLAKCRECNYQAETVDILINHIQDDHANVHLRRRTVSCEFWMNGFCKFTEIECKFLHKETSRNQKTNCLYGMNCRKGPGCPFYHPQPCHFQQNCRNANCRFWHFNNQESFLDLESTMEFPPLQAKRGFQPWMMWC